MIKVLEISSSPRKNGSSGLPCDQFLRGAAQAGHRTERLRLAERDIRHIGFSSRTPSVARRMGPGVKIVMGDKKLENAQTIAKTMNDAGYDVTPVVTDISSRESILALIAGGRSTAPSPRWSTARACPPARPPLRPS